MAIHDPVARVAGLLHYMLPDSSMDAERGRSRPFMFADTGIPMLFHAAYDLGGVKERLTVTAMGGAQVIASNDSFNIGKRNHLALRKILWKAGVLLHAEDLGGSMPRSVRFEVESGRILISSGREQSELAPRGQEKRAQHGM